MCMRMGSEMLSDILRKCLLGSHDVSCHEGEAVAASVVFTHIEPG